MKKITSAILMFVLTASLTACGSGRKTNNYTNTGGSYTSSTTATAKTTKVTDKAYSYDGLQGKYTGDWADGKPNGYSKFIDGTYGDKYNGNWKDGVLHGFAEISNQSDELTAYMSGTFSHGYLNEGYMEYNDGNHIVTYQGELKEFKQNGQGVVCLYDINTGVKGIYKGEFLNGDFYGQHRYQLYDPNGNLYETGIYENGEYKSDEEINREKLTEDIMVGTFGILFEQDGLGDLYDLMEPILHDIF